MLRSRKEINEMTSAELSETEDRTAESLSVYQAAIKHNETNGYGDTANTAHQRQVAQSLQSDRIASRSAKRS
jgi:hypothetical protein